MKARLERYVGHLVRLNDRVFQAIKARHPKRRAAVENCFVVVGVSQGMRKLICYGANIRIVVSRSEVMFI